MDLIETCCLWDCLGSCHVLSNGPGFDLFGASIGPSFVLWLKAMFFKALLDLASSVGLVGSSIHRGMSSGRSHAVLSDQALSRR